MMKKKIMVVDDYMPSIERMLPIIKGHGHEVLAIAHDGQELIRFCYQQKVLPEIVLLDIHMPKMDGVTTMEFMGMYFPAVKVIAFTSYCTQEVVDDMLSAGACGFICKDREMSMLGQALDAVVAEKTYIDPRLHFDISKREALRTNRRQEKESLFKKYALSKREKEILALVVSNLGYNEISTILNIAPKTIENTINNLSKKLGTTNGRAGLILQSLRVGLTKMVNLRGS